MLIRKAKTKHSALWPAATCSKFSRRKSQPGSSTGSIQPSTKHRATSVRGEKCGFTGMFAPTGAAFPRRSIQQRGGQCIPVERNDLLAWNIRNCRRLTDLSVTAGQFTGAGLRSGIGRRLASRHGRRRTAGGCSLADTDVCGLASTARDQLDVINNGRRRISRLHRRSVRLAAAISKSRRGREQYRPRRYHSGQLFGLVPQLAIHGPILRS